MWLVTVNAKAAPRPSRAWGSPTSAGRANPPGQPEAGDSSARWRSPVPRADVPGALDHASGDVDEFDAALVRGAGGVPVDAGGDAPVDLDGVAADPEHLSEREIEDEAEAEGDLSEDEIQEIAGQAGRGETVALPLLEQASGAPQRGGNRAMASCVPAGPSCSGYSGLTAARSSRLQPSSWVFVGDRRRRSSARRITSPRKSSNSSCPDPLQSSHRTPVKES